MSKRTKKVVKCNIYLPTVNKLSVLINKMDICYQDIFNQPVTLILGFDAIATSCSVLSL